jgi:signal transduction histidine kinase
MRLSNPAVVSFINGLFGEDYPTGSAVTTLNVGSDNSQQLAIINGKYIYRFEFDSESVIRAFEDSCVERYSSENTEAGAISLKAPKAIVIYLESTEDTPKESQMRLEFSDGTSHLFKAPTLRLLDYSAEQLAERNLALLLPFCLLRLRGEMKRRYALGTLEELSPELNALLQELLDTAERCEKDGSMTHEDMRDVQGYIDRMFEELKQERSNCNNPHK